MVTGTPPLLSVRQLRTQFETPRGLLTAVDGVSFDLAQGSTLGIVGESGSGKSVLSRSIMGLLPANARVNAEAEILFDGQNMRALPEVALRRIRGRDVAIIFQDPMTSLNPVLTVGKQIAESIRFHLGLDWREAYARAEELVRRVGIPQPERRVRQYPHELSGGMRQRVAIAIALSCEPKLLIADEPTTALDVTVQAEILELLREQQIARNMAMILITHDLGVVAGRSDQVAVMYAGRIVEQASTKALFHETRMPYTEALLQSIPRLGDPPHTPLQAIPGRPPNLINPPLGCRFAPRCRYVQARCNEDAPHLENEPSTAHQYACWYPLHTDGSAL